MTRSGRLPETLPRPRRRRPRRRPTSPSGPAPTARPGRAFGRSPQSLGGSLRTAPSPAPGCRWERLLPPPRWPQGPLVA